MKYYLKALRHYADFGGRARRKEFWYFVLFNFIFAIVAMVIDRVAGWGMPMHPKFNFPIYGPCYTTFVVAMALPGVAVMARRLHDIGKSGWFALIGLIPAIGAIWLIILWCKKGETEQNRFGINPIYFEPAYSERGRLKSISITFIIAAACFILNLFVEFVTNPHFLEANRLFPLICSLAGDIFILLCGISLYPRANMEKGKRKALYFLAGLAFTSILRECYFLFIHSFRSLSSPFFYLFFLFLLLLLVFAIAVLRKAEQKTMNVIAILLIIFVASRIIMNIIDGFALYLNHDVTPHFPAYVILYMGYILLAAHYLPRKITEETTFAPIPETPQQSATAEAETPQPVPAEKPQSLFWIIFNFAVSIFFIWGGLNGELVLRGTESSGALAVVGFLYLAYNIYALIKYIAHKSKAEEKTEQDNDEQNNNE